jgi:hypothetical protein
MNILLSIWCATSNKINTTEITFSKPQINITRTKAKAKQALQFCKSHNFNANHCILIDMSLHSGIKRFVVWNFAKDTIAYSLVLGWAASTLKSAHSFTKQARPNSVLDVLFTPEQAIYHYKKRKEKLALRENEMKEVK